MENKTEHSNANDQKLIQEAYAATLDPARLEAFENYWEAYLDASLQQSAPGGLDLGKTEINAHIKLALGILERMRFSKPSENRAQKIVDSNSGAGFIINENGKIVSVNIDAKAIVRSHTNLRDLDIDNQSVEKILNWASTVGSPESSQFLFQHVLFGGAFENTCLFVMPVDLSGDSNADGEKFFLITSVDFIVSKNALSSIRQTYDLSKAEADVAMKLANGNTPTEIAKQRVASIHTVRTQIKNSLTKTNSRSIAEMVRTFTAMSARFEAVSSQAERAKGKPIKQGILRRSSLTLPDGRNYEYTEQGHPNGIPVLQIHSLMAGVEMTEEAAEKAVAAGFLFITPSRAGYGNSDRNPQDNIHKVIECTIADAHNLLVHLKIQKVILMGGWVGCFLQRFALKYPDMVYGILQLDSVPVWDDAFLKSMKTRHRVMIKTSIYAPLAVSYLTRIAKALIDSGREHVFIGSINENRKADTNALQNQAIYNVVAAGFRHMVKQGVRAFIDDLPGIHTDWLKDARNIKCPVTVLHGTSNGDQPKEAFERYQNAVPHAKFLTAQDAGAYLYLTHFNQVLVELRKIKDSQ